MAVEYEMDEMSSVVQPLVKERQSMHSTITQPAGQPPIQEVFMAREYTPTELTETAAQFQAWSVRP